MNPINFRPLAEIDFEQAVDYYTLQVDEDAALRFIDELHRIYAKIADNPNLGSPRYAHKLKVAGLRHWPVKRFPYILFYIDGGGRIDVLRILHGSRDIAASLMVEDD